MGSRSPVLGDVVRPRVICELRVFPRYFGLIPFNAHLTVDGDSLIRPSCLVKKVLDPVWGWKEIKIVARLKVLR